MRRFNELKSIINQVKSEGKLFTGSFPEYPLQYEWSHKNKKYNVYFWEQPKSKPKAILINFHALNAHTGLSGHLAADLAKDNILVGGYDYFNFGKSEGEERGNISSV